MDTVNRGEPNRIRTYSGADRREYQRMRLALWPDCDDSDIDPWMARPDATTFLAVRADDTLCGFVEVGARSIAEACETSPVGFLEGWYVDPDARGDGIGRALLAEAEEWARAQGYTEMGSDAELDNLTGHDAHRRCGYEEVGRVVQFRKLL